LEVLTEVANISNLRIQLPDHFPTVAHNLESPQRSSSESF